MAVGSALLHGLGRRASAADAPQRLVLGFSAGGGADAIARLLAASMTTPTRPVIVENKPGAGGRIAIMSVRGAEPDGLTTFFGSTSVLTLFPHVFKALPYELDRDFTPVSTVCSFPYAIVTSPQIGVSSIAELAQWARAHPNQSFFGTPGLGTPQHLIGSLLAKGGDMPLEHVPFKSGGEATLQLLAGTLPVVIATAGQFYPLHKAGKVRIIATTAPTRATSMTDIPTCAESGRPDVVFEDSFGLIAPARTPAATIDALNARVGLAVSSPSVQTSLKEQDLKPLLIQGAAYLSYLAKERARWREVVQLIGFTPVAE